MTNINIKRKCSWWKGHCWHTVKVQTEKATCSRTGTEEDWKEEFKYSKCCDCGAKERTRIQYDAY